MSFKDSSFSVVLDKGTLDALFTDTEDSTMAKVEQMWAEIGRVLSIGGRYICVSLAQDHILKTVVEYFSKKLIQHYFFTILLFLHDECNFLIC